ncbi:M23 family metallopeptidase [Microbacterium sp. M1A1_1b]
MRATAPLPLAVMAVVTCFLVTVTTPQQAAASTVGATVPTSDRAVTVDTQDFTVPAVGPGGVVVRDGFAVAAPPVPTAPTGPTTALDGDDGIAAVRPVAGSVPTAGGFGGRWVAGCGACSTNHQGLDFAAATGTPVVAAMPGRVVSAGVSGGYGNQVLVQHAGGLQTRYGHLSRIDVAVGQVVTAGERVGAVGSSGVSTGPHLHFEVIVGGRPVDPAAWLDARGLL